MDKQTRRAQRAVSRRERGSNRHKEAVRHVAKLKAREARVRKYWQHELTTDIARNNGSVKMEKLRTQAMTASAKGTVEKPGKMVKQKSGLNRAILNIGWAGFQTKLEYKLKERGGELILVPAANTSRECSACGHVDQRSRKSQAVFVCTSCGFRSNADLNAAKVIEKRGEALAQDRRGTSPSLRVEARGCSADEA
jgi:putative transposase